MTQHDIDAIRDRATDFGPHSVFYGPQDREALLAVVDRVIRENERLRTAWASARRRAARYRAESEQGWEAVGRYGSDLANLRKECDELRQQRVNLRKDLDAVIEERNELRRALPDAALIHVATPEGIAPCGAGVHDVATTAIIREATCLECLSTIAQATHGGTLPEEDIVEPGDEVPDLAELADRVTALEELTRDQADLLERHSRALEPPVLGHAVSTPPPAPARYRDRRGDAWEDQGDGTLRAIAVHRDRPGDLGLVMQHDKVTWQYGPLTPVTDETAGGAE